jgi:hypothetical protein
MNGAERIAAERRRQIEGEGWTPEHDDEHTDGALAYSAVAYAAPEPVFVYREAETAFFCGNTGDRGDRQLQPAGWREVTHFGSCIDKRGQHDRIRQLEIAGALIAAEIDRLTREEQRREEEETRGRLRSPDWFEATG